jgi:D-tagatose-1,6-bisphosphate aldolase subunit GatZ/KbaZ
LIETLEAAMLADPRHWQKHYHGTVQEQALARRFSLSDRIRYYWSNPTVQKALKKFLANLDALEMPLSLLSQYSPDAYRAIRSGELLNSASEIILYQIRSVLDDYSFACGRIKS